MDKVTLIVIFFTAICTWYGCKLMDYLGYFGKEEKDEEKN